MSNTKKIFMQLLEGPLAQAKEWEFSSGLFGGATAEIRCPKDTKPIVGAFTAPDGVRRVVIAAWFPPETGEEFYADIPTSS